MNFTLPNCVLVIVTAGVVGCTKIDPDSNTRSRKIDPPEVTSHCTFRGGMCGHEHRPVCALRRNKRWETYPNACQACRDSSVVGYRDGRCK
jgi:hypothetical protein